MEREIIFRGKELGIRDWAYGDLTNLEIDGKEYAKIGRFYVDPSTVGQYTGLTDRNGKKIFEGDLLKYIDYADDPPYLVYWRDVGWNTKSGDCMPDDMTSFDSEKWEIIGNKWDNPELLEVKE